MLRAIWIILLTGTIMGCASNGEKTETQKRRNPRIIERGLLPTQAISLTDVKPPSVKDRQTRPMQRKASKRKMK